MADRKNYEAFVVLSTKLGEEDAKKVIDKISKVVNSAGKLESIDEWGKRRLAYEINKETEGVYYLFNFEADTDLPDEFNRICKITEGILRYLVIAKEA